MCGEEIFDKDNMYEIRISKNDDNYITYSNYITTLVRKVICENCFNKMKDMLKRRVKD